MSYPKLKRLISRTQETSSSLRKQLEVVAQDLNKASIGGQTKFRVTQCGQALSIQAVNPYAEDPVFHQPVTIMTVYNDSNIVYDMDSCLTASSGALSQLIDPSLLP